MDSYIRLDRQIRSFGRLAFASFFHTHPGLVTCWHSIPGEQRTCLLLSHRRRTIRATPARGPQQRTAMSQLFPDADGTPRTTACSLQQECHFLVRSAVKGGQSMPFLLFVLT